jgi:hypothetical protein
MKLSEAILLGSTLKPQAFGPAFDGKGTCALGAAKDAIGNLYLDKWGFLIWPWTMNPDLYLECPCLGCGSYLTRYQGPLRVIIHLNDDHEWTRERIAGWVASIEAKYDRALQDTVPEVLAAV